MSVKIIVPGLPVPKGRPKASSQGGFVRMYTPAKTKKYETIVREEAYHAMQDCPPLVGAAAVHIDVYLPVPASWSKKKTYEALTGSLRPCVKPDLDNYVKAALDGINDVVLKDDNQVVDLSAAKHYSAKPRLEIEVTLL